MPLHLLGKKSWNVYNTANIERVRRDEAEAQAREAAADQLALEQDAARRMKLLRGESVEPLPLPAASEPEKHRREDRRGEERHDRKRRRLHGEDDTDRDIRVAREQSGQSSASRHALLQDKDRDAPLVDHAGHIQLLPAPDEADIRRARKHADDAADKAQRRTKDDERTGMRFRDAAGYHHGSDKPWYTSSSNRSDSAATGMIFAAAPDRNVFGKEDPLRKDRERSRLSSNDPFAAMQSAQRQLKQSERDRDAWQRARLAELGDERRSEKRHREHRSKRDDEDSLGGFSLDAPADGDRDRQKHDKGRQHSHRHGDRRHHRSRSRSPGRDARRRHDHEHRRRHRSRER